MTDARESLFSAPRRIVTGTSRQLCRHVAERWHQQYGDTPSDPKHAEITKQLRALRKKGTRQEIDAIIGNSSWTTETCDVCEQRVETWVTLSPSDYDGGTCVCAECLDDAVAEIENV